MSRWRHRTRAGAHWASACAFVCITWREEAHIPSSFGGSSMMKGSNGVVQPLSACRGIRPWPRGGRLSVID